MLLVPDEFYPQVAAAVDATHLGTKLTYQDIDAKLESLRPQAISARSLAATIVVEHGRYEGWIQHQLSTRFDHVRAESIEEFRSHRRAVTKAGQLRDGSRHVKDDRSRIDDRSRWVLFENSDARIDVLTAQQRQRKNELNAVAEEQKQFESKAKADAARIVSARRALETEKFAQIDVSAAQNLLDEAQKDLDALVDNNDRLAELQAELRTALGLTNLQETEKANLQQRIGVARDRVSEATATIERLTSQLAGAEPLPPEVERRIAGRMKAYARAINASNIDAATIEVERKIRADKSAAEGQCSNPVSYTHLTLPTILRV